jgi:hypothetical protein
MKARSALKWLLVLALAITGTSCSWRSGLNFNIDTTSPRGTYRVVVEGRADPPEVFATVQQVSLKALRGGELLLADDRFYREEMDHLFTDEYPIHKWLSDSVLRFGKEGSPSAPKTKLVLFNNTSGHIDLLQAEYGIPNEKFLAFDIPPGGKIELEVILQFESSEQDVQPLVSYMARSNGRTFKGMIGEWRRVSGAGPELVGEIIESSGETKANISTKPTAIR